MEEYAVVKFISDETYSEVPVSWLSSDQEFCFWPKTSRNLYKLMAKGVKPESNWDKYAISVECRCRTLTQARRKAENAETTENEDMGKGKRRRQTTKASSSSESDEECYTPPPNWKNKKTDPKVVSQASEVEAAQAVFNAEEVLEEPLHVDASPSVAPETNDNVERLSFIAGTPVSMSSTITTDSTKLNTLLDICTSIKLYVKSIDARLKLVEHNKREIEDDNTISTKVPLHTLDALRDFEQELTNETGIRNKFVQYITSIGGRHAKDIVNRILKKLYTNQLGTSCSWLGQRNNFRICDLLITKLIKEVVMKSYSIKEREFENYVSEWFRLSKLRLQREQKQ